MAIKLKKKPATNRLKEAKKLYDKMYKARLEVETFRGIKYNAPKAKHIALANAIIELRNSEVALAQALKSLDLTEQSELHIYGRKKQGLET